MPEHLEGVVERITFYNAENGYTVLRLRPNKLHRGQIGKDGLATVIGGLPELQPGESVRFSGVWTSHKDFGSQFSAESVEQMAPATVEGLRRYLGSGLIKGVGPVTAKKIVAHFGMQTLDILDQSPDRLLEVSGVGKHRATLIGKAWITQKQIKEVMLFLQSHRVTTALAVRIYKAYGDSAIQQVQANPYKLAQDIYGIGFKTADQIALNLGLPFDSAARVAAGVVFALNELTEDGHVYGSREEVTQKAAELLGVSAELCDTAVEGLRESGQIMVERIPTVETAEIEALYLPPLYHSEKGVANRIKTMLASPGSRLRQARTLDWSAFFEQMTREQNIALTPQQQDAVREALLRKVSILTGGPGTGKTTSLRAVIHALEAAHARYALASPTGRAAKRLSEATGRPAQTIHRLLGFKPGIGFLHDENAPLDVDMLVVDEASMLDLVLFYNVLKALMPDTHLLLVGDVDQLPSVGPGDVLHDLIRSQVVHITRLATIFRQAGGSLIIANAHRINKGEMPDLSNQGEDFFLFKAEDADTAADLLVDVVQNRIPKRFGLDPIDDIQVLAPMYRGSIGVGALNERLQAALNPAGSVAERLIGGRLFRVGDKVIQMRNNYDKEVFNGDLGRIHSIDFTEQTLQVAIDERLVEYDWADASELTHAYAISVHRSQGSEYPAIVLPVMTQHYLLLQRNLLYTAVTRAKRLVVLVGTRKAIAIAVRNDKVMSRYSGLTWRLRGNLAT
ncbi:MAG: SF1B family DNA helicase RecD2 [Aggregatilineales bacterium]